MEQNNCAFEKAEILPGNIGYLELNAFGPAEVCAPTATAAMNFLANTGAIIFDLRQNNGGDPDMVQFICSYLFDHPTRLSDIWTRKDSSTQQYWTLPYVPGKSLAGKPAYVLTSKQTFSGGEEFTYDLKNLKRATIVGETTGGGAHPVDAHRIGDRFVIAVPFATAVSPITHTSWEGTGVEPDVKVSADSALARAEKLAADTLERLPK
jgi:C-terminal processing protease CtpA/Prc